MREYRKRLSQDAYRKLRAKVFERDNGRCVICGRPATDCHHVIFRSAGGDDDINNLVSLCRGCHAEKAHGVNEKFWCSELQKYLNDEIDEK